MRFFVICLGLAGVAVLVGVLGQETLTVLAIGAVVALIGGMVVVGWPERPPRRVDVYRKDDMDWPAAMPMIEAEWRPAEVAGLLVGPVGLEGCTEVQ